MLDQTVAGLIAVLERLCLYPPNGRQALPPGTYDRPADLAAALPTLAGAGTVGANLTDATFPGRGQCPKEGKHTVNTQLAVLRTVRAAAAAVAQFLVVHAAVQGLTRTTSVLPGTLQ